MSPRFFRRLRRVAGLTQSDLARLLHVHRSTVSRWEAGLRPIPGPAEEMVKVLAAKAR